MIESRYLLNFDGLTKYQKSTWTTVRQILPEAIQLFTGIVYSAE